MKISTRLRTQRIVRSTRFTMRRETRYQRNDKWTERAGSKNSKIAKRQSSRRCTYTPVYIALLLCTASPRLFAPRIILYRHGAPCPPFSLLSSPPRRHTRWWKWDGSTYAFIESDAPLLSSSPSREFPSLSFSLHVFEIDDSSYRFFFSSWRSILCFWKKLLRGKGNYPDRPLSLRGCPWIFIVVIFRVLSTAQH